MTTRIMTATAIAIAATLLLTILPSDTWTASGAPAPLNPAKVGWSETLDDSGGTLVMHGTKIYAFGTCGYCSFREYKVYDPRGLVIHDVVTNTTTIGTLNENVTGASAVSDGTNIFILGGASHAQRVARFDPVTRDLVPLGWTLAHDLVDGRAIYDASAGGFVTFQWLGQDTYIDIYAPNGDALASYQPTTFRCTGFDFHGPALGATLGWVVIANCASPDIWDVNGTSCMVAFQPANPLDVPHCIPLPTRVDRAGLHAKNGKAFRVGGYTGDEMVADILEVDLASESVTLRTMQQPHTFRWSLPSPTGTHMYGGSCIDDNCRLYEGPCDGGRTCRDIIRYS